MKRRLKERERERDMLKWILFLDRKCQCENVFACLNGCQHLGNGKTMYHDKVLNILQMVFKTLEGILSFLNVQIEPSKFRVY